MKTYKAIIVPTVAGGNSKINSADGYTETQIIKPINYHRVNTDKPKIKSFQRFIINRASSLKSKITNAIYEKILERISKNLWKNFVKKFPIKITLMRHAVNILETY